MTEAEILEYLAKLTSDEDEEERIRALNKEAYFDIKNSTMPLVDTTTWVDPK